MRHPYICPQLLANDSASSHAASHGIIDAIASHKAVDSAADTEISVIPFPGGAGGRLVVSPTGALDRDYDDCRLRV